jgi:acyl carrier protein
MPAAVSGLSDSANLYDAGLTSLACVSLMLALEDDFDLEFPDALLKRSTFETIGQLSMAIESLLGPA